MRRRSGRSDNQDMPDTRRNTWYPGLTLHAAVIGILLALLAVMVGRTDGVDANIGAGLVLIVLLGLGLPWSLPVVLDLSAFDDLPGVVWYALRLGPALLWLGLHVLLRSWYIRHRTTSTSAEPTS